MVARLGRTSRSEAFLVPHAALTLGGLLTALRETTLLLVDTLTGLAGLLDLADVLRGVLESLGLAETVPRVVLLPVARAVSGVRFSGVFLLTVGLALVPVRRLETPCRVPVPVLAVDEPNVFLLLCFPAVLGLGCVRCFVPSDGDKFGLGLGELLSPEV